MNTVQVSTLHLTIVNIFTKLSPGIYWNLRTRLTRVCRDV